MISPCLSCPELSNSPVFKSGLNYIYSKYAYMSNKETNIGISMYLNAVSLWTAGLVEFGKERANAKRTTDLSSKKVIGYAIWRGQGRVIFGRI